MEVGVGVWLRGVPVAVPVAVAVAVPVAVLFDCFFSKKHLMITTRGCAMEIGLSSCSILVT